MNAAKIGIYHSEIPVKQQSPQYGIGAVGKQAEINASNNSAPCFAFGLANVHDGRKHGLNHNSRKCSVIFAHSNTDIPPEKKLPADVVG